LLDNSKPLERVGRKASGLTPESAGYGSRVAVQRSHLSNGCDLPGIAKPFERGGDMRDEIRWFLRRSFLMERNLGLQKGFTLMELMITIAIISILAAIAIPNYLGYRTKAKIAKAKAELNTIESAIQALAVDTGLWPTAHKWYSKGSLGQRLLLGP
jgi:prepilin-type N-terminal cleavage/methylation domain-containing protein